jgi:hypothetical protein
MSEIAGNKSTKKTKVINSEKKVITKKTNIGNPKGTITLNEALLFLKEKSDVSKMGLRIAAVRDGFKSELVGNGREKFLLDVLKFKKWVKTTIEAIPEGFVLVAKSAKELNITSSYVYALIKRYKIKMKTIGAGKGKVYVDFVALKNVCNKKKIKTNYKVF